MTKAAKRQRMQVLTLTKKQLENGPSQTFVENGHKIHPAS